MVSLDVVVSFSSSGGSEAVSSLLSVPNDDSGMFLVMPIALFISEAVRATSSLLLSFAGGDTSLWLETHVAFVVGSTRLCTLVSPSLPRVGVLIGLRPPGFSQQQNSDL